MKIENKTLMETLIDAGYPREEMYHHCSDLYIFWTPKTARIVDRWYKEHGLNRTLLVKPFKDQITGRLMLDCAFQYDVYWDEVAKRKEYRENCPQYPARIVMAREKIEKDKN